MRFRGMSIPTVIRLALSIAIILTIYAYFFGKDASIKKLESTMNNGQRMKLYAVRFVHYFAVFSLWGYAFFVSTIFFNDAIFAIVLALQILHWLILGECILSILEKKIMNPHYVSGSDRLNAPPFWIVVGMTRENDVILTSFMFLFAILRLTIWRK